jgi:aminoglycoside/choline kinase family phosphotransferase
MTAARADLRSRFLASAGWDAAVLDALPGDASFRHYFRLRDLGRPAMLMDAPPPQEDVRPFLHVAKLLHALDYSAPCILAADAEAGFLVLEDLGDATYTRVMAAGADEAMLYALATDLLVDLHNRFALSAGAGLPAYSDERLLAEAALLVDWFLPEATGAPVPASVRAEYLALWQAVLPLARRTPETLVLRDYHIDNLMWLDARPGLKACGLLDFQDAVIGPAAYDLVSLIEDARRDIAPEIRAACRARYLAGRPDQDAGDLDLSLAVLGAQRHAKVIGIFCRLMRRDGKPVYLDHLPRLWRLIGENLAHPALKDLETWMNRIVPPALRGIPDSLRRVS